MSLFIHRAERTDRLADALGDLLGRPLADPFAEEVVVVPARGVERWLTQRLSHRLGVGPRGGDGVCAGVRFLTPHTLVSMLLDRERDDPWHPDQLVWPLLGVIDAALGEPGFEALSAHLGHGGRPGDELRRSRRWSVARRLAGLFASYAVQRPRLVAGWTTGPPEGGDSDGTGHALDEDLRWEPELWRRLVARLRDDGIPPPDERHRAALAALDDGGDGLDLPPRLSLFGHTRLPETEVDLLRALGRLRDVHLWLPQVSAGLWDDLAPTAGEGRVPRAEDGSAALVGHPLLASLGRDARELRRSLGAADVDDVHPAPDPSDSLLGWLQADLRANAEPDASTRSARVLREDDASVQVHACHGPARQVDVLREVLVGLLEDSKDDEQPLEPRDILVMCPDIEGYAPLVSAGFGLADLDAPALAGRLGRAAPAPDLAGRAGRAAPVSRPGDPAGHPAHQLRVRLADRSPGATNPLLAVAATLVDLAPARVTAGDVLDLAATEPVRRRFGLDDDDLDRLAGWVEATAIRWGLDAAHRAGWGLSLDANTWARGLRRVLLGAAVSGEDHRVVADVLPLDDVGDGDLELVGTVVELVDRLHTFVGAAAVAGDAAAWAQALRAALAGLTSTPPADAWQAAQVDRELGRLTDARGAGEGAVGAEARGPGAALRHADVRALLGRRLEGRPTRSNFRTGTLTVCTMVPMRSVPHRVVCLVGLDDDVFPRSPTPDGDDVLARRPRTGERDARSEDRQLLLDAVGAATETLVVTYTGRGVHTGLERPPAVPLGELQDALERTAAGEVRERVLRRHPLQPHDEANMGPGRPFTFDAAAVAGARAARAPARAEPVLVPAPLAPLPPDDVALADLHDFLAHPVRAFLRGRLRVGTGREHEELGAGVPLELDALETWKVGDRLVRDVLEGASPQDGMRAEQLRGTLPPGRLGVRVLDGVKDDVRGLVEQAAPLRRGRPRALDVDIRLRDGRRLTGTVSDLYGTDLVRVSFSRLGARHRLAAWLDALALAAGHPDESFTAHTVGKHRSGAQRALLPPLDHRAADWLGDLVEVWDRAMTEPAPLPVKTGLAWAEEWRLAREGKQADPDGRARKEWTTPRFSDHGFPREDDDAWHALAFGERAPYERLALPARPDDPGREPAGHPAGDPPHRLGRFAWAVWCPLLTEAGEQVRAL